MRTTHQHLLSTLLVATTMTFAMPLGALAYHGPTSVGMGFGLHNKVHIGTSSGEDADIQSNASHKTTLFARSSSGTVSTEKSAHIGLQARCKHLENEQDRTECLRLAALHVETRGDAEVRANSRALHGKFTRMLHRGEDEVREEVKETHRFIFDIRMMLRDIFARIKAALTAQASVKVEACAALPKDEQEKCFIEAKASLKAKGEAALKAILE